MEKNWETVKLVNFEPLILILKSLSSFQKGGGVEPIMTYVYHFNPSLTNYEIPGKYKNNY